jgi:hypothetical protein
MTGDVLSRREHLWINAAEVDLPDLAPILEAVSQGDFLIQINPAIGAVPEPSPDLVVTFWSRASLLDERVVALSSYAQKREILFPVRIEDVDPPIGFRQIHTVDFVDLNEAAGQTLATQIGIRRNSERVDRRTLGSKRVAAALDFGVFVLLWVAGYFSSLIVLSEVTGLKIETRVSADWRLFLVTSQGAFALAYAVMAAVPPVFRYTSDQPPGWTWFLAGCLRDLVLQSPPILMLIVVFGSSYLTDPLLAGDGTGVLISVFAACAVAGVMARWLFAGSIFLIRAKLSG